MSGDESEDRVVFVDAICVGCQRATVANTEPEDGFSRGSTFARDCPRCGEITPHNVLAFLSKQNREREDAIPWDPDEGAPKVETNSET